jgi:hypothetical protein
MKDLWPERIKLRANTYVFRGGPRDGMIMRKPFPEGDILFPEWMTDNAHRYTRKGNAMVYVGADSWRKLDRKIKKRKRPTTTS